MLCNIERNSLFVVSPCFCVLVNLKYFRAVYKDGAGTDEDGSYSEIGCATDITVVPCDFYDADYPMDFGHVEIQQSGCKLQHRLKTKHKAHVMLFVSLSFLLILALSP